MVKASLTLPNGTIVQIEGTMEEVRGLLQFYSPTTAADAGVSEKTVSRAKRRTPKNAPSAQTGGDPSEQIGYTKGVFALRP